MLKEFIFGACLVALGIFAIFISLFLVISIWGIIGEIISSIGHSKIEKKMTNLYYDKQLWDCSKEKKLNELIKLINEAIISNNFSEVKKYIRFLKFINSYGGEFYWHDYKENFSNECLRKLDKEFVESLECNVRSNYFKSTQKYLSKLDENTRKNLVLEFKA